MCEYVHNPLHDEILSVVKQFPEGILSRDIATLMDKPVEYVMPRVCELFTNDLLDAFEPKATCNEWCIPTPRSRALREAWDATHDPRTNWRAALAPKKKPYDVQFDSILDKWGT